MLALKNTLTEMTSAVCADCVAWRCEVGAMVENKAGKAARVDTGSLPNDLEGQICLVSFFHLIQHQALLHPHPCSDFKRSCLPV